MIEGAVLVCVLGIVVAAVYCVIYINLPDKISNKIEYFMNRYIHARKLKKIEANGYDVTGKPIIDFEDFKKRSYVFFENLVSNYPNVPIFVIAPIWRADHNEKHKLGSFSTIANTLKQISNDCKDLYFIDGIDFIPKDRTYYRDGYLHPNENGFKLYADALLNELYQTILQREEKI